MATNTTPTANAEATPKKPRHRKVTITEAWNLVAERRQLEYSCNGLMVQLDHLSNQRGHKDEKVLTKEIRTVETAKNRLEKRLARIAILLARFDEQQAKAKK